MQDLAGKSPDEVIGIIDGSIAEKLESLLVAIEFNPVLERGIKDEIKDRVNQWNVYIPSEMEKVIDGWSLRELYHYFSSKEEIVTNDEGGVYWEKLWSKFSSNDVLLNNAELLQELDQSLDLEPFQSLDKPTAIFLLSIAFAVLLVGIAIASRGGG